MRFFHFSDIPIFYSKLFIATNNKFDVNSVSQTRFNALNYDTNTSHLKNQNLAMSNFNNVEDRSNYYNTKTYHSMEMSQKLRRHYEETITHPNTSEFVKPYLKKVCGSYFTSKNTNGTRISLNTKDICNQEFIDRAFYEVVVRGYVRKRKRYNVSYPTYGENLHNLMSTNRVMMHYPREDKSYGTSTRMLEVIE